MKIKNHKYEIIHQQVVALTGEPEAPFICTTTRPMTFDEAMKIADEIVDEWVTNMADEHNVDDDEMPGFVMDQQRKIMRRSFTGRDEECGWFLDCFVQGKLYREYFWLIESAANDGEED